jgi:Protein of unknown function (DUF3313)
VRGRVLIKKESTMFGHSHCLNHRTAAAFAAALLLPFLAQVTTAAESPSSPLAGLERVASKNVATLYKRPDVDTSAYSKIMIGEPVVQFSKNWNPRNYGTFGLSAAQLTKIRVDLAAMAASVLANTLRDGGYEIVTEAGDGVLSVTPNIVNVYINAPEAPTGGSKSYTMSAGSAGLALLVNDAVTGTLLAAVFDQVRDQSSTMRWTTSTSNRAAAETMLKTWARQLKLELDAARAQ